MTMQTCVFTLLCLLSALLSLLFINIYRKPCYVLLLMTCFVRHYYNCSCTIKLDFNVSLSYVSVFTLI